MKRFAIVFAALTTAVLTASAQNIVKGDYGYLYCHMSDGGEYTAYALSRDGYHYEDIIGGKAVIDPKVHARIEGGQRDAFITRSYDGKGRARTSSTGRASPSTTARAPASSAILRPRASIRTGAPSTACGLPRSSGIPTTYGRAARRADI